MFSSTVEHTFSSVNSEFNPVNSEFGTCVTRSSDHLTQNSITANTTTDNINLQSTSTEVTDYVEKNLRILSKSIGSYELPQYFCDFDEAMKKVLAYNEGKEIVGFNKVTKHDGFDIHGPKSYLYTVHLLVCCDGVYETQYWYGENWFTGSNFSLYLEETNQVKTINQARDALLSVRYNYNLISDYDCEIYNLTTLDESDEEILMNSRDDMFYLGTFTGETLDCKEIRYKKFITEDNDQKIEFEYGLTDKEEIYDFVMDMMDKLNLTVNRGIKGNFKEPFKTPFTHVIENYNETNIIISNYRQEKNNNEFMDDVSEFSTLVLNSDKSFSLQKWRSYKRLYGVPTKFEMVSDEIVKTKYDCWRFIVENFNYPWLRNYP